MIDFFRRKKKDADSPEPTSPSGEPVPAPTETPPASSEAAPPSTEASVPSIEAPPASDEAPPPPEEGEAEPAEKKVGWFGRLKRRFSSDQPDDSPAEPAGEVPAPALEPPAPEPAAPEPPTPEAPAPEALANVPEPIAQAPEPPAPEPVAQAPETSAPDAPAPEVLAPVPEAPAPEAEETPEAAPVAALESPSEGEAPEEGEAEPAEKKVGWFGRLKKRLSSTREKLAGRLEKALSAVRTIDEDVLDELEEILVSSDLGIKTTNDILYKIRGQVAKKELKDVDALKEAIRRRVTEMLVVPAKPPKEVTPLVQMIVGVNGVGKTTTIAKLARIYQKDGKKVLLAAGDTFRAAAVEQLTIWANRLGVEIVSQPTGADPSAVVFDSLKAAQARGADRVIVDTAGRLHTKVNLMDELKKIKRVASKALPGAPHETILVLDANTGQNAASQAKIFHESIGIDSLIVTKLDGTSKGGVIVSIINEYKIPIKYIGIGESFEDLRPFNPDDFVEAILGPAHSEASGQEAEDGDQD
ncbi:MAG: signal recognition particle-docking protein FtsY [Deltaproteobacteria bacterium]|nr:signal recognition particle-docking protein FtsY [Deltaproteobacteria bacterium]